MNLMSKRLTFPKQQRPQVVVPSYQLPSRNFRQRYLEVPEHDETLLDLSSGANKQQITDRGRYAEAFFKINHNYVEMESDDEYLL